MMKVTYYSTLYKREVTDFVRGKIVVEDGKVKYMQGSVRYAIPVERVRSIEETEWAVFCGDNVLNG